MSYSTQHNALCKKFAEFTGLEHAIAMHSLLTAAFKYLETNHSGINLQTVEEHSYGLAGDSFKEGLDLKDCLMVGLFSYPIYRGEESYHAAREMDVEIPYLIEERLENYGLKEPEIEQIFKIGYDNIQSTVLPEIYKNNFFVVHSGYFEK